MKIKYIDNKFYLFDKHLGEKITRSAKLIVYNRFVELTKKSVKLKDLVIGFEMYDNGNKMVVMSEPYINKHTNSLFIDVEKTYTLREYEGQKYTTHISLCDHNIVNGGYNLYRLFANKYESIEYSDIAKSYTRWGRDSWDGRPCLEYSIKPIPGPKHKINFDKYEIR